MFSYQFFYLWKMGCTTSQLCDSEHFPCGFWVINTSPGPFHICYSSLWPFKDTHRGASHTLCKWPKSQSQLIPWYREHLPIAKRHQKRFAKPYPWKDFNQVASHRFWRLPRHLGGKNAPGANKRVCNFQTVLLLLNAETLFSSNLFKLYRAPAIRLKKCHLCAQPLQSAQDLICISISKTTAISCL